MKIGQILGIGNLPLHRPIFVIMAPSYVPGACDDYFLAKNNIQFTLSGLCLEVGDKYVAETADGGFISLKDYGVLGNDYSGTRSFYDAESAKEYAKSLASQPIPDWMDEIDFGDFVYTMTLEQIDRFAKNEGVEIVEVTIQ